MAGSLLIALVSAPVVGLFHILHLPKLYSLYTGTPQCFCGCLHLCLILGSYLWGLFRFWVSLTSHTFFFSGSYWPLTPLQCVAVICLSNAKLRLLHTQSVRSYFELLFFAVRLILGATVLGTLSALRLQVSLEQKIYVIYKSWNNICSGMNQLSDIRTFPCV